MNSLETEMNPRQTLAVFIGASVFRRAPGLAQGPAFHKSAEDFRDYVLQPNGLGLPYENLEWLFDDARSPGEQLENIGMFLDDRCAQLKACGTPAQDLIVYYVGHGLFCGVDQHYCFAIRQTAERSEGLTSIRASDLAAVVKERARFLRKYFILDCCFSAAAYRELQSGPLQSQRKKVLEELPRRGTTLLCSAGSQDASLAPEGLSHTMFSNSLLAALRQGHHSLAPRLSFSELGDLIKDHLRHAYPERWVRPEIHSPDQAEGDIADIRMFPNAAHLSSPAHFFQPRGYSVGQTLRNQSESHTASPDCQATAASTAKSLPPFRKRFKRSIVAGVTTTLLSSLLLSLMSQWFFLIGYDRAGHDPFAVDTDKLFSGSVAYWLYCIVESGAVGIISIVAGICVASLICKNTSTKYMAHGVASICALLTLVSIMDKDVTRSNAVLTVMASAIYCLAIYRGRNSPVARGDLNGTTLNKVGMLVGVASALVGLPRAIGEFLSQ